MNLVNKRKRVFILLGVNILLSGLFALTYVLSPYLQPPPEFPEDTHSPEVLGLGATPKAIYQKFGSVPNNSDIIFAKYASNGDLVVIGDFYDTSDLDMTSGVDVRSTSDGDSDYFISAYSSTGQYKWSGVWEKTNFGDVMNIWDIDIDVTGNIYVTGYFDGIIDMDPTSGVDNHTNTGTVLSHDGFLVKLSSSGTYQAAYTVGDPDMNSLIFTAVRVGLTGNIYIGGTFIHTIDFDPGVGITTKTSTGPDNHEDGFIAKYDSSFNFQWVRAFGGVNHDPVLDIDIGYDDEIFALGYAGNSTSESIDFNDSPGGTDLRTVNGTDAYIVQYYKNGNYGWSKIINGVDDEYGLDIDANYYVNEIAVLGAFDSATTDFDGGIAGTDNIAKVSSDTDFFISKYTFNGTYLWTETFGVDEDVIFSRYGNHNIALMDNGDIYFGGEVRGNEGVQYDFDPTSGIDYHTFGSTSTHPFFAKLNTNGEYQWSEIIVSDSDAGSYALAARFNTIVVGGYYDGSVDFDFVPSNTAIHTADEYDGFLVEYLDGTITVILNVNSSLDVFDATTGLSAEIPSNKFVTTGRSIQLKTTSGKRLADTVVDLRENRDWSSVIGDLSISEGKAFVKNIVNADGVSAVTAIYIPVSSSSHNGVWRCPNVTNLSQVRQSCTGGVMVMNDSINLTKVTLDGQQYWKLISPTSDTGGLSAYFDSSTGSVDTDNNEVDDSEYGDTSSGATSSGSTSSGSESEIEDYIGPGPFIADKSMFASAQDTLSAFDSRNLQIVNATPAILATSIYVLSYTGLALTLLRTNILRAIPYLIWKKVKNPWGVVYDYNDGKPLAFSTINVYRLGSLFKSVVCDQKGRYSLVLDSGEYEIEAKHPGYKVEKSEINVDPGENNRAIDIAMVKTAQARSRENSLGLGRISFTRLNRYIFLIGFVFSILVILYENTLFNQIILSFYIVVTAVFLFRNYRKSRFILRIVDQDNDPLMGAIVRIIDLDNKILDISVTAEDGLVNYLPYKDNMSKVSIYKSGYTYDSELEEDIQMVAGLSKVIRIDPSWILRKKFRIKMTRVG